jgi:hypothetical protein
LRRPAVLAAAAAGLAALAALTVAHDARSWRTAISHSDHRFAQTHSARWQSSTWLPGDLVERLLGVEHEVALRRAVVAFLVAAHAGRGFDNGEHQARVRSAATVALAAVAADGSPTESAQANDLLGVLVSSGGGTGDEQAIAAFQAAVRADPSDVDAKVNLELALRRALPTGVRRGPGNGSGTGGAGRRGAGSGTPGRGY